MKQITVRLRENTLENIEAEADDRGLSRSEYLRDVIDSRNTADADVDGMRDRIDELEDELNDLRDELADERSRADRLAGRLDEKDNTIESKEDHIESLESTVYEQQQAMTAAVTQSTGVFGRIRSALGSGDEEE